MSDELSQSRPETRRRRVPHEHKNAHAGLGGKIKVKKKKRKKRSGNYEKQLAERRKSLLKFLIITCTFIGTVVVVSLMAFLHVNSKTFKTELEASLSTQFDGDVLIKGLIVAPVDAEAKSFDYAGDASSMLLQLSLNEIELDHSLFGVFGATWRSHDLGAKSGYLKINLEGEAPKWNADVPINAQVRNLRCSQLDIDVVSKAKVTKINEAYLTRFEGETVIEKGKLDHPWLGESESFRLKLGGDSSGFDLDLDLSAQFCESFQLKGSLVKSKLDAVAKIKGLDVAKLDPRLEGVLHANVDVDAAKVSGDVSVLNIQGDFKSDSFVIKSPGIVELLKIFGISKKDYFYDQMEVSGKLNLMAGASRFSNVMIELGAGYYLTGSFDVFEDLCRGKLRFYVPAKHQVLVVKDELLSSLFTKAEDGAYFIEFTVSGQTNEPSDDLLPRLGKDLPDTIRENSELETQLEELLK